MWRGSEHHWEVLERQPWCEGVQMPLPPPATNPRFVRHLVIAAESGERGREHGPV